MNPNEKLRDRLRPVRGRRWLWMPLAAFIITRLGIAAVAYFSTPILADSSVPPYHIRPENTLVDVFASRWDTGFYLSIADEGYRYQGEDLPSVAFFPLLPMLMRAGSLLTGDSLLAGILVANLAVLAAVVLLYRYVESDWGSSVADRAVWYLLIFPASLFGSAIYTESLFLLLSIAAFSLARRRRWWGAGLTGILAGLTRLLGVILAPALLVEWWQQRQSAASADERPKLSGLIPLLMIPLGTLVYMAYLKLTVGDALAFMHASAAWGREAQSPLTTVMEMFARPPQGWTGAIASGALPLDNWMDLLFVLFFLAMGAVLLKQRRWSEATFVLLGALIPLSSGLLMSQRRYMWALFPVFILLGRWGGNPWVDRVIFVVSLLWLGLFTAMFANWYWVG
jgi:hypothetical protein